jgi:hypothetical protein
MSFQNQRTNDLSKTVERKAPKKSPFDKIEPKKIPLPT